MPCCDCRNLIPMIREVKKTDGTILSLDFGLAAMKMWCEEKNTEFFNMLEFFNKLNIEEKKVDVSFFDDLSTMVVCAGKNAARKKGTSWEYTSEQVLDWISDQEVNLFELLAVLIETMPKAPSKPDPQSPGMKSGE